MADKPKVVTVHDVMRVQKPEVYARMQAARDVDVEADVFGDEDLRERAQVAEKEAEALRQRVADLEKQNEDLRKELEKAGEEVTESNGVRDPYADDEDEKPKTRRGRSSS